MIGPSWVGDMVMAQGLFIALTEQEGARVDVVAPAWSLPLIRRMPEVSEAVELPVAHGEIRLTVRRRVGRDLARRGYGRAIVLPRSFKSALIPWFARIPVRTGYVGEMRFALLNDVRRMDSSVLTQTAQRYVALGYPADAPQPPVVPAPRLRVDQDNQSRLMTSLGLGGPDPVVAVMPGAEYGPAKCWPLEYFGAAASKLADRGYRVWILGSGRDHAAGQEIERHAGGAATNLCGQTELEDAIDLLAWARHAVTNDSGLMHVAAAVGCHVIGIYGSSTPAYTPPLTDRSTVRYLGLECSPCFRRECPLGHLRCLREIPVTDVIDAVEFFDAA